MLYNRNQGSVGNYTWNGVQSTLEKEIKFVVTWGGGGACREEELVNAVKRYKTPSYKIIDTRDIAYNMVAIINMAVWWEQIPKVFITQIIFYYFFNFKCLCEMMDGN